MNENVAGKGDRAIDRRQRPRASLADIDSSDREEMAAVDKQIAMIQGSLKDLAHRIETGTPDAVVFLDLSARIFGSAYVKYLGEVMGEKAPAIKFYNDQALKGAYLYGKKSADRVEEDFASLRGKKVYFVDETFSAGKGAVALEETAARAGADAYYFALSRDPRSAGLGVKGEQHDISEQEHNEKVQALQASGRITVYNNPIRTMFSRNASRMYVQDWQGETLPRRPRGDRDKSGTVPDANSYITPPDGMTREEYDAAVSSRRRAFVQAVKDKIYQALKS